MKKPEIETVTFSDGASVTNEIYELGKGVSLKVHSKKEGVLTINSGFLEFEWNRATEQAFISIETITASEIFEIIAGNPL